MDHLGDITKINGAEIEPVDCITAGSPCQDLSVAGKRAGLEGERSGLFMEQIRIIKEMREHDRNNGRTDEFIRPRYMVWENVPGAFSSNKGEDFRCVLEETAKVAERDAVIPGPPKGKWSKSGAIMGDGWSIAWRLHDAQFWGVPQRRKRIALVADFGGQSAPEILFERKGMRRDPEESGEEREGTAAHAQGGTGKAISFQERAGKPGGGKGILIQDERIGALSTLNNQSVCCLNDQGGSQMGVTEDITGTLRAQEHGHQPLVFEPGAASRVGGHVYEDDVAGTVRANAGDNKQAVCYGISSYESNAMKSANPHSGIYEAETARTLDNNGGSPACNQGGMAVVQSAGFDGNMGAKAGNIGYEEEKAPTLNAGKQMQCICIEGNGSRPSHKGDGYAESDTMYTLNSTEHHAVAYRGDAITSPVNASNPQPGDPCHTLTNDGRNYVVLENHPADSRVKISEDGMVQTLSSRMGTGGGNVPMVMESSDGDIAGTLDASYYKGCGGRQGRERTIVAYANEAYDKWSESEKSASLRASGGVYGGGSESLSVGHVVRRLTPLECERLQGFPDGWTDIGDWIDSKGKKHKGDADSPRYKALGNSIALPFWFYLLRRISAQYERPATLGSLFDGIGGFPLCWERCNGIGTARWASEIEEFPIAVTKAHFGGGENEGDIRSFI